jgi:glucose/arabinose dehydrogenase
MGRAFLVVLASLPLLLTVVTGASAQLRAALVAGGLQRPTGFVQVPSDPNVQVILEQAGRVRVLKGGVLQDADLLDLRGQIAAAGEQGLLGLAFAPDFATSGRVFVSYTNLAGHSVVSRYRRASNDPLRVDPNSRFDLLWPGGTRYIEQPFANHNGGHIAFGPDGYLYFGLGDGGSGRDPYHFAQHPMTLLGKMVRIDVAVADADREGYDIPASNPFRGRADILPEIWAFGLRNPWRWSFDPRVRGGTGALLIADVGQTAWEEINYEPAGAGGRNYGWRNREGAHDLVTTAPAFGVPLRDPIHEYPPSVGRSITGGFVYRGAGLGAEYIGRYFFGDYVLGRVWSMALLVDAATGEARAGTVTEHTSELGATAVSALSSFGVDAAGELYLVNHDGAVYRIERIGGPAPTPDSGTTPDQPASRRRGTTPATGTAQPRPR